MNITERIERSIEHERQRFEHVVLGRPRPAPTLPKKPKGMTKAEWKVQRAVLLAAGGVLVDDVEQVVAQRERWSHKAQGTPETHEANDRRMRRPGSIARLYASKAIDRDQLDAADQIREAHRAATADIPCRTASWEMGGGGGTGGNADLPLLAGVDAEYRYDWWCASVAGPIAPIVAIIVDDVALTVAAARYAISTRRMRQLLIDALDLWWKNWGSTKRSAK